MTILVGSTLEFMRMPSEGDKNPWEIESNPYCKALKMWGYIGIMQNWVSILAWKYWNFCESNASMFAGADDATINMTVCLIFSHTGAFHPL